MYQQAFSSTYCEMVGFMLLINLILMIRLVHTAGIGKDRRWILGMLTVGSVCALSDSLCVLFAGKSGRIQFYLLNAVFFLSYSYISFLIYKFTASSFLKKRSSSVVLAFFRDLPVGIVFFLDVISYWTGWAFKVDDSGVYSRGPLFVLFYGLGSVYNFGTLFVTIGYFIKNKHARGVKAVQPILYALPIIVGTLLQCFFSTMPYSCMGLTVAFLVLFMNNQEMLVRDSAEKIMSFKRSQIQITEALLHDCAHFFEFDVTTGMIEKPINIRKNYDPSDGLEVDLPISYDQFYRQRKELFGLSAATEEEETYWTREGLLEAWKNGKQSLEIRYESEQLMLSWVAAIILMEDQEDHHIHGVYICKDVTELKLSETRTKRQLEQALSQANSASDSKTQFLFNMSHDIRTPMNAIIGFTNLLEKEQDDPRRRQDYIHKIKDSSDVLLSIINNVLEMARIEKGSVVIEAVPLDMMEFGNSLRTVFESMMKEKKITYTTTINVESRYVYGDPTKLKEIFLNLISNAYKYTMPGGSVSIEVTELPSVREGYARFRTIIADTGIGMSQEYLPHLYEEFSRENSTTDARIEGTGLGMPIVKKLLDMLGGTIDVQSKKGVGTVFTLSVNLKIAEEKDVVKQESVHVNTEELAGKRILMAEDNDLNAEIAMAILNNVGIKVDRALNGEVCYRILLETEPHYYDLVLMDVQMPVLNGYEATKKIRAIQDREKAEIPIIAMTANAFAEDRKDALEAGMNGHIAKPVDVQQLFGLLKDVIK